MPTLTPISRRILAAIASEPGERTVRQLAADLQLPHREVKPVVDQLARRGLLAPRQVRLHAWATRTPGIENDLEILIFLRLTNGPQSRADLARLVHRASDAGDFKRALKRLHTWGAISLPAEVDPSEAGLAALSEGVACAA